MNLPRPASGRRRWSRGWPAQSRCGCSATPEAWVIGSDQVAVHSTPEAELMLGKPGTEARCKEQLQRCSGRAVEFLTAVAVMQTG